MEDSDDRTRVEKSSHVQNLVGDRDAGGGIAAVGVVAPDAAGGRRLAGLRQSTPAIETRAKLLRKPERHHVAVGHLVLLAFQPQLAGFARASFAAKNRSHHSYRSQKRSKRDRSVWPTFKSSPRCATH
jgi:hypothetical protein